MKLESPNDRSGRIIEAVAIALLISVGNAVIQAVQNKLKKKKRKKPSNETIRVPKNNS